MDISHLYLEKDFVYVRMQGIIWAYSGLLNPSSLEDSSVVGLEKIYQDVNPDKPLIICFKGIERISGNDSLEIFLRNAKARERKISFINVNDELKKILIQNFQLAQIEDFKKSGNGFSIFSKDNFKEEVIIERVREMEKERLFASMNSSFRKLDVREKHFVSTSIIADGEFDAGEIISDPKYFMWICLLMVDELNKLKFELEEENKKSGILLYTELKLIAVSLRGSPFCSAIGLLSNIKYDVLDHLGPKHKLFDTEVLENVNRGILYIYIGDFAAGGTEIKIAKTYINLINCKLKYALVIGSLLKNEVFKNDFELISLIHLKEVRPEVNYELPVFNNLFEGRNQ
ncbi:MAG: hypothetical protein ABIY50_10715 [Ignavibacteria bacterium]